MQTGSVLFSRFTIISCVLRSEEALYAIFCVFMLFLGVFMLTLDIVKIPKASSSFTIASKNVHDLLGLVVKLHSIEFL